MLCLFVFVEFDGGSAKATVEAMTCCRLSLTVQAMTCCRPFFFLPFFLFVCSLIPAPPTGLMPASSSSSSCCFRLQNSNYLLRVVLSMQQQSSSSCCFVRATGICSSSAPTVFLLQPFLSLPILLHHILRNTCRLFCFVFFLLFFHFFPFFSYFSFFVGLWSGLFCCVLVPGTLASNLLYLDELRLTAVRLFCFTRSLLPHNNQDVSLEDEESARTLGVLMSLGKKKRTVYCEDSNKSRSGPGQEVLKPSRVQSGRVRKYFTI